MSGMRAVRPPPAGLLFARLLDPAVAACLQLVAVRVARIGAVVVAVVVRARARRAFVAAAMGEDRGVEFPHRRAARRQKRDMAAIAGRPSNGAITHSRVPRVSP